MPSEILSFPPTAYIVLMKGGTWHNDPMSIHTKQYW
jgi:hypothetical protein